MAQLDNTETIKGFLEFPDDDTFYFAQVMLRRKDHPEMKTYSRIVQTYYIHSEEDLERKMAEIRSLCSMFGARAYINPNQKSYRKAAMYALKELACVCAEERYRDAKMVYNSVCGQHSKGEKKWIVDIDTKDQDFVDGVAEAIESLPPTDREKVLLRVPTRNGVHLITRGFNMAEFRKAYPGIDVHKDNPTLLYAEWE